MDSQLNSDFHTDVVIHKGYHGAETFKHVQNAWQNNGCLILCPPHLKDTQQLVADTQKIPKKIVLGVFTSGTLTGKPRLVLYTKKNIESSLRAIRDLYQTEKIDKIFCYPQPTHTFGLTLGYVQACVYNIPLIFYDGPYSSGAHQKWLAELTPGTMTLGTPTHLIDLIDWVKAKKITPLKSYTAILGGAPVPRKLWRNLVDILNIEQPSIGYGATEASPGVTHLAPGIEPQYDGMIGQVLSGVTIESLDAKGYVFSGENVCAAIVDESGYHAQNKIQIKDDLTKLPDGNYVFNGRSDLIVNRGGIKISPELIESTLLTEFNVKTVCVPFFSERLGEDVALVVTPSETATHENIQNFLNNKMALKISSQNIISAIPPVNANAKIDRVEALKMILRHHGLKTPMPIEVLRQFLPHRPPAIWIDRLTSFAFRKGDAEVDLDLNNHIFTNSEIRESACIEMIAQAYGYSMVAYQISQDDKAGQAQKTLIAEVKRASFFFNDENKKLVREGIAAKGVLLIETECSHDFGAIKVIHGVVKLGDVVLAKLSLKAFVAMG